MESQSIAIAPVPSKFPTFPTFPRLPAEIRLQIWETHLANPASEPILATMYHYNSSQPILCISPLMTVSHESRCAALSWAHTHCQRDSMEDGYRIGNSKEKIKMENSQLDLPDFLNWHAQCRHRLRVESDMLLRQRAKRQAPGSASLCPSLTGPEQELEPQILLRAPFNSLPSDRRIKHIAISAGHLAPCLDDAGLAELWKMFRMEDLFIITLPLSDDDGPWCYRMVWRYGLGDPSSVPLPPQKLGCGVFRWFQGQDQEGSQSQPQPQPQPQSQSYFPTRSVSDTSEKKKVQKQGVVATTVWNPETRPFS